MPTSPDGSASPSASKQADQQDNINNLPTAQKVELILGLTPTASAFQNATRRNPGRIFRLASDLLVHHRGSLDEMELYSVYEQGVQAALDLGHDTTASEWILVLMKRFGKQTPRVRRLVGLFEEARGNVDKAQEIYESIRAEHPLEAWPVKRLAAIMKSRGRIGDAIALLETKNVYRDRVDEKSYPFRQLHPLDDGTLRELIHLHWVNNSIDRSIYYCEELLLLDAHNFLFLSRLGELCYSAGNFERAITAYSQSVRLNPHASNCRAVFGLWQSALEWRHHSSSSSSGSSNSKSNRRGGGGKKNTSVADIDDDDDDVTTAVAASHNNSNDSSSNVATAGDHSAGGGPQMTLVLVNNLINVSEARLKQHYQNSPLMSVLELTLRRYGSR